MKIKSAFDVKYLQGAMDFVPSPNQARGACFYRSAALVLDLPESELCIGTLPGVTEEAYRANSRNSPTPFIHCWVEWSGELIAPTDLEKHRYELGTYSQKDYYEFNCVRDVHRLARWQVQALASKNGWYHHFLTGEPCEGDPIAFALLGEARVPFEVSSRGGIVPHGTKMPPYAA